MVRGSGSAEGNVIRLRPGRACPICRRPSSRAAYPFCSKRCADIDLNRWLSGAYAIPAAEEGEKEASGEDGDSA